MLSRMAIIRSLPKHAVYHTKEIGTMMTVVTMAIKGNPIRKYVCEDLDEDVDDT